MRAILGNIGVLVLPDQLAVAKAHEAFKANPKQEAKGAGVRAYLIQFRGSPKKRPRSVTGGSLGANKGH